MRHITIYSKRLTYSVPMVLLMLCAFRSSAQPNKKSETKEPLYFIDKQPVKYDAIEALPPGVIEESVLMKYPNVFGFRGTGENDVMSVLTHKFVIAAYQEKLAAYAQYYYSYLKVHKQDDKKVTYLLNGKPIAKDRGEAMKLYHISRIDILGVDFKDEPNGKASFNIELSANSNVK